MATLVRKPFNPPRKTQDGIPSKGLLGTKNICKTPLKPYTIKPSDSPKPKIVNTPVEIESTTCTIVAITPPPSPVANTPPLQEDLVVCIPDDNSPSVEPTKSQPPTPPSTIVVDLPEPATPPSSPKEKPTPSPPAKKQKLATPPSSPPSIDLTHSGEIPQQPSPKPIEKPKKSISFVQEVNKARKCSPQKGKPEVIVLDDDEEEEVPLIQKIKVDPNTDDLFQMFDANIQNAVLNRTILDRLKEVRDKFAAEAGVSPVDILSNKVLEDIVATMPETMRELREIKGVGPINAKKYGTALLSELKTFK